METVILETKAATLSSPDRQPGEASSRAEPSTAEQTGLMRGWRPVLVLALVAIAALLPMVIYGIPTGPDLPSHYRFALPFYDALREGSLYPGWLAGTNGGYGDPSFRFYPPALYYLLAATRALTGSWFAGSVVAFMLLSITGALGTYFWARSILAEKYAIWAGVFFTLAPYHINEIYQSFLLAEYAGAAVLPFCFAFVERVGRKRRLSDVAGLAVSYALLIFTHLPLAVIGSIGLLIYALMCIEKEKRFTTMLRLALGCIIGLAASACYWVNMVAETKWIGMNNANPDSSFHFDSNFLFSTFSTENSRVWWANILGVSTIALLLPALLLLGRASWLKAIDNRVKAVAILTLFSLFMATPLSWPIWKLLTPLQETQFPWRWLAIISMAGSVLVAATIPSWVRLARTPARPFALLAAGSVLAAIVFTLSHGVREAIYLSPAQFNETLAAQVGSPSISYWFPIWAKEKPRAMSEAIEISQRPFTISSWEPERRVFQVTAGPATDARIRTFYYPHWVALSGDSRLAVRPSSDGAMLVALPAEAATVELKFQEPPRARFVSALSLIGWLSAMSLLVFGLRKRTVA